jgi:hypothetical protein
MAMHVQSGAATPIPAPLTAVGSSLSRRSKWTTMLAFFCATMLVFAATLRIAHSHTAAEQLSGHCPICIALHAGIPTASAPVQVNLHATPDPIVVPAPKAPVLMRVRTLADRAPPTNV